MKGGYDDGVAICVESMDHVVDWEVHCKVFFFIVLWVLRGRKPPCMVAWCDRVEGR